MGTLVVTHQELRAQLWPADTFVDFDHSVHNAVARLREALGESAESPRFIETLPRRGYRFVTPIDSPAIAQATASAVAPRGRLLRVLAPAVLTPVELPALGWI